MTTRTASALLLLGFGLPGLTACAVRKPIATEASPSLEAVAAGERPLIGRFSGRFHPARNAEDRGRSRRFVMDVERRRRGEAVIRIRGRVAGTALIALLRGGRVELLFRRERQAVTGPDTPAVWMRWTGLPLSGKIVEAALYPDSEGVVESQIHGWRVTIDPPARGEFLPTRASALGADGARLELTKTSEKPGGFSPWPVIPASFRIVEVDESGDPRDAPSAEGGAAS